MTEALTFEQAEQVMREADCLHSGDDICTAIDQLAADITAELKDSMPVVLTVMNGGLVLGGQLLTKLNFPLEAGYLHATRYRGEISGQSDLQWQAPPSIPLEGRTVLILDDIFDEGHTLAEVVEACRNQGAERVLSAVLINKLHDRKDSRLTVDFIGLDAEDRYLFGYGMDYRGYWRNANGIYAVKGL